jgi:hypothetical protein
MINTIVLRLQSNDYYIACAVTSNTFWCLTGQTTEASRDWFTWAYVGAPLEERQITETTTHFRENYPTTTHI